MNGKYARKRISLAKTASRTVINEKIFRAYDIRGKYPSEINEAAVFEIAKALGRFFGRGKIIVARDGRLGSAQLYQSVIRGLDRSAVFQRLRIVKAGLATTPMFYFLVNALKGRGGIMVTASHNPKEYNGLKVVGGGAGMISGREILKIVDKQS